MVVCEVKKQCNNVIHGVIKELEQWFPLQEIMNVMCIIYPQSWFQLKVEHIFFTLLNIMKVPHGEHSFFIIENYMSKNIRSHILVKLGKNYNSISSIIRTCLF